MNYYLNNIYMNNYKLFDNNKIEINNANLFVFDGPNGYGKTSLFEAIEYLLTGTINRIEKSVPVNGNIGYYKNVLANKIDFDTYIEGEFQNGNDSIFIKREIRKEHNAIQNNPQKLRDITSTTIKFNNEILIEKGNFSSSNVILTNFFGIDLSIYYNNFYYISQEDRLSLISKKESQRFEVIDKLININKEKEELKKFENLKSFFTSKEKKITNELSKIKKEEQQQLINSDIKVEEVSDINLFNNKINIIWDDSNIVINNEVKLKNIIKELKLLKELFKFKEELKKTFYNKQLEEIILDSNIKIISLLLSLKNISDLDSYVENINFLIMSKKLISQKRFLDVDFSRIFKILEINLDFREIKSLLSVLNIESKKLEDFDNQLIIFKQRRKDLKNAFDNWGLNETISKTQCPYCGHTWDKLSEYNTSMNDMGELLDNLNKSHSSGVEDLVMELQGFYDKYIEEKLEKFINENNFFKSDDIQVFKKKKNNYVKMVNIFNEILDYSGKKNLFMYINSTFSLENIELYSVYLKKFIRNSIFFKIDNEDFLKNEQIYYSIFEENYSLESDKIIEISDKNYINKIKFLQYRFYNYINNLKNSIFIKRENFEEELKKISNYKIKIESLINIYKKLIKEHQKSMITKISVPLYIYTGRILQNYQGGLGIFVINATEELNNPSLRFVTPKEKCHDILYTLSSGQLTGFIISFVITLNKLYGSKKISYLLIDDPIQTMDELNIASLVEIFRNEFKDYQLLISTHEQNFSRYIRYKYTKYNLSVGRKRMG